jgi:hypothetical protein
LTLSAWSFCRIKKMMKKKNRVYECQKNGLSS